MTHTTDAERAEFEKAWRERPIYMGGVHQKEVAYIWWTQAARRAPAVPVPQGLREAAQRAHDWMESQADSQSKGNHHSFDLFCLRQERDALAEALAAAPQPPEADHIPDAGKMVAAPVPQGFKLAPTVPTPEMIEAAAEAYMPFGDMGIAVQMALNAAPQPPEAAENPLQEQLDEALQSLDFYKRRCNLLQSMQASMRDPERTIVCDVLANGQLLEINGMISAARYGRVISAPVQMPEPVAAESRFTTFAGNRWRCCTVEHARAFGADKGYEIRYLYTEQQVRELLAAHGIQEQST